MDYNVAIYAVAWVILIWAIFGMFAHADYMETLNLYLKDNPNVCIMSPEPSEEEYHIAIQELTKAAIQTWQYKLTAETGGDWNFPMYDYPFEYHDKLSTDDFPHCNIFIVFEKNSSGKTLGTTGFDYSNSKHKWAYITVWTHNYENVKFTITIGGDNKQENIKLEQKHRPLEAIYNIILHEFGHALGIGHYQTLDENCKSLNDNPCSDRSIMFPSLEPFSTKIKQVTSEDIQMMIRLYGEDGFGYPNPAWNPKSCDFLDGKLDKCR
jgi:hypothetical protein